MILLFTVSCYSLGFVNFSTKWFGLFHHGMGCVYLLAMQAVSVIMLC